MDIPDPKRRSTSGTSRFQQFYLTRKFCRLKTSKNRGLAATICGVIKNFSTGCERLVWLLLKVSLTVSLIPFCTDFQRIRLDYASHICIYSMECRKHRFFRYSKNHVKFNNRRRDIAIVPFFAH